MIVGFIALFIVIAVMAHKMERKRVAALQAWASSKGWRFSETKDHAYDERYGFSHLRQGSNRYAHNISSGQVSGRGVKAFDYHWETHSTDSKGNRQTHTHRMSALIIDAKIPLKPLEIRPEGFFDKMKGAFGFDDIDFESAEFSRKFFVKSPDRKWAYDVLHARVIELLLAQPHRYTISFDESRVFVSRGSGRWKPPEFEEALDVATKLMDHFPDYLKQQQQQQQEGL